MFRKSLVATLRFDLLLYMTVCVLFTLMDICDQKTFRIPSHILQISLWMCATLLFQGIDRVLHPELYKNHR